MKKMIKILSMLLVVSMLFTGCSGGGATPNGDSAVSSENSGTSSESNAETGDSAVALTVWTTMHALEAKAITDPSENRALQEILKLYKEETGKEVTLTFEYPPVGMEEENFSLMISSGTYPDMIWYDIESAYKGGVAQAIADNVVMDVTEIVEAEGTNFKNAFKSMPETLKGMYNDNGQLIKFGSSTPVINQETGELDVRCFIGPVARKDLLDAAGLKAEDIKTISDWENMLTKFKEAGVSVPLGWGATGWEVLSPTFIAAFGTTNEFQRDDDVISYGPITEGYKAWLETFNRWYQNGLLDPNFATNKYFENVQTDMMAGKDGATCYHIADLTVYNQSVLEEYPERELVPLDLPVAKEGDKIRKRDAFDTLYGTSKYVTTSCKTPEEAVKFVDFLYDPRANEFSMWGIEGESYIKEDGNYVSTESYKNDPNARWVYTSDLRLLGMYDARRLDESYVLDAQQDAFTMWGKHGYDLAMPSLGITFTTEEDSARVSKMADITTRVQEMTFEFIINGVNDESWESYVSGIKEMGIEDVIKIYQDAYNRYLER